jgi:hypothetical protein
MKVRDENLADSKARRVPHHLSLGTLAAVEQEDISLSLYGDGADVAADRRA